MRVASSEVQGHRQVSNQGVVVTTVLRTVLTAARVRRTTRHLVGVSFCDGCAQVSDSASRVAERRRHAQMTAFTHAR
jgi:predicted naringenin-chalcone synthase